MTEAEFERRIGTQAGVEPQATIGIGIDSGDGASAAEFEISNRAPANGARTRATRAKPAKIKRVQRMFAIEEDVDKKLWLYAIHMGKDRSEVVNDLLRPIVASMVLYDSRDRRSARNAELAIERASDGDGEL
jgi:hypothetical protein